MSRDAHIHVWAILPACNRSGPQPRATESDNWPVIVKMTYASPSWHFLNWFYNTTPGLGPVLTGYQHLYHDGTNIPFVYFTCMCDHNLRSHKIPNENLAPVPSYKFTDNINHICRGGGEPSFLTRYFDKLRSSQASACHCCWGKRVREREVYLVSFV